MARISARLLGRTSLASWLSIPRARLLDWASFVSRLRLRWAPLRARDLPLLLARAAQLLIAALRSLVAPAGCAACDTRIDEGAAFCAACASAVVRVRAALAKGRADAAPAAPEDSALEDDEATTSKERADAAPAAPEDSALEDDEATASKRRADAAPAAPENSALEDDILAGSVLVAYGVYGGAIAKAVRRFKYGERPDLAEALGGLLCVAAREGDVCGEVVVPVPLHPRKLRARGYNQAALLAAAVAREIVAPLEARALLRTCDTRPQASLEREARRANVAKAIRIRDVAAVRGRHVVLVDDVITTGATLRACREALLSAGAARVTGLVLARADPHA